MKDIRIKQKQGHTVNALGTGCAAGTITQIVLRASFIVRVVLEIRGIIVLR